MTILYLTFAWVAGIIVAFYVDESLPFGWAALVCATLFAFTWPYTARRHVAFGLACLVFFFFGAFRLQAARPEASPEHIANLNNQGFVTLYGVVTEEPDLYDSYTNVRVKVDEAQWLGTTHQVEGVVLVRLPANSPIAYGDRLMATGELHAPPTMDAFEYREKLARQGVFSYLVPLGSEVVGHDEGRWDREFLIELKEKAQKYINDALPEPQAALLSGILLGDDRGMTFDIKEAFTITGTSHIVAISGFNMALIAQLVSSGLGSIWSSKKGVWAISLLVIGLYTIFVGASASVVRAAIMSGVLISAPLLKHKTYVPASLAFTALVMSVLDPWVLWDIGFQLSLAAVLGMSLLVDPADRIFHQWMQYSFGKNMGKTVAGYLSEPLVVGLVAQFSTLPIILYYFGRLSLVSPLVNLLVVPVQSLVLFWGGSATLLSFLSPTSGALFFQATWLFLLWTTEVVRRFAALPLASVEFSLPQWGLLSFAIGAVALTMLTATRPASFERWWLGWRQRWGQLLVRVALPVIAILVLASLGQRIVRRPDGQLHVTYLDMGQSNSALIESPDGAVFLIDGGRFPTQLLTELGDRLSPSQKQIDILFITSDQYDDINGLVGIIQRYEVKTVISGIPSSTEDAYIALMAEIARQDIPLVEASADWRIETADGLEWQILATSPNPAEFSNMALRLRYGEAVFLFTNRLSAGEETALLQQPHLVQASVLQAADHAADGSNSETWVAAVNPQVVIVQNDPGSREPGAIGHVMARFEGRRLFRTDKDGVIEISTDGRALTIQTEN